MTKVRACTPAAPASISAIVCRGRSGIYFGSRDPHRFDSGQATELIDFLASVLEHVIRIWLHLPD